MPGNPALNSLFPISPLVLIQEPGAIFIADKFIFGLTFRLFWCIFAAHQTQYY